MRDYEAELLDLIRSSEDPKKAMELILAEVQRMLEKIQVGE